MFNVDANTKLILVQDNQIIETFQSTLEAMKKFDIFLEVVGERTKGGIPVIDFLKKIAPELIESQINWNKIDANDFPFIDDYFIDVLNELHESNSYERGDVIYHGCAIAYYFDDRCMPVCYFTEVLNDVFSSEVRHLAIRGKLSKQNVLCFSAPEFDL